MKAILENRFIVLALRVGFGIMYLVACWDKILDPERFSIAVFNYHMLPNSLINLMAICLPWVELLIGIFLIAGVWTEASALVSAGLCVMFLIALSQALVRGYDIACGCFTQDSGAEKINYGLVIRDILLVLGSIWILVYNRGRLTLLSVIRGDRHSKV